jgi:hypothetical protein
VAEPTPMAANAAASSITGAAFWTTDAPPAPVADAIRARHAKPVHVNRWVAQNMRRTDQPVLGGGR